MTDFKHYRAPRYWLRLHIAAGVIALAVGVAGWGAADDYAAGQEGYHSDAKSSTPGAVPAPAAPNDGACSLVGECWHARVKRRPEAQVRSLSSAPNVNVWVTYFAHCIDGDTVVYIDPWDGSAKAIQCSVVMLDSRP